MRIWNDMLMNVRMRRAMLDTEEEDGYLIALWPLSSSKQRANASIVPVRCLLTSSAFLLLLPMPSYIRCLPACSQKTTQNTTTQIHLRSRALGIFLLLLKTSMIMLSLPTMLYTPGHGSTNSSSFKKRPLREKAKRPSMATFASGESGGKRSIPESLLLSCYFIVF